MAVASDKTKKYLDMMERKFNYNDFQEFIVDLLNLEQDNIVNGNEQRPGTEQYKQYIDTAKLYANYEDDKRRKIGVIIIRLKDNKNPANARTLQRNFIAHLLDFYSLDASLTAIYSNTDDTWRLSFVKQELKIVVGKLKTEVSPAKRYSYLFGEKEPNHTAKGQLLGLLEDNNKYFSIEEIEEKFSVEKVTKDFFENYKENYLKLYENLEKNKEFIAVSKESGFTTEEFAKKLMGQIVFLYFLQKKGWLGVRLVPNELTMEEYVKIFNKEDIFGKKILEKYYINANGRKKLKGAFLKSLKENEQEIERLSDIFIGSEYDKDWGTGEKDFVRQLFIRYKNMNASRIHDRFFDDYLEPFFYNGLNYKRKNQYFSVFNCKIPFLNGGLFEPIDNYAWELSEFKIEDNIFSNDEGTGILDFFDRYNFTINEEEPLEKDVAVDPEMLGKIFENLLDVKDRRSKGAFYTPREIVHYMCQESLAKYLVNKIGTDYNETKDFIQYGEIIRDEDLKAATAEHHLIGETIFNNVFEIDDALKNIKIADPAVGSGAFPLGILNEIVKLRDILTSYILIHKRLGLSDNNFDTEDRSMYSIKWDAIKNSIYAVDIENSAVDITKLRLWLSIVVDQIEVPKTGPEPLPNLDCKIMQGNSLVDEYEGTKLIDKDLIEESKDDFEIKPIGKKNINNQMRLFSDDNFGEQYGIFSDEKRSNIHKLIKLKEKLFGINNTSEKRQILKEIDDCRKSLLRVKFRGNNKLDNLLIIDNSHNKPYFSWELEFIEVFVQNEGFDIVIGNPPYIKERDNSNVFNPVNVTRFGKKYHQGKMDFWYYFLHKAIDLVTNDGNISFITPRYWINSAGATLLIERIKRELCFNYIVDIGKLKVFDNVVGYHMISQYSKKKQSDFIYKKLQNTVDDIDKREETENLMISILKNEDVITSSNEVVLEKRDNYPGAIPLGEIVNISQGVVEASDRISKRMYEKYPKNDMFIGKGIFVLSDNEIKELKLSDDEKTILVPYVDGNDMSRYHITDTPDKWLIYSDKDIRELIASDEKYIRIKNHLDNMFDYITSSNAPYGLHRPRKREFFENPKIIMPSMFANNDFTIDYDNNYYVGMSFQCMIMNSNDYTLEYILAILNSDIAKEWFYSFGKKRGAGVDIGVEKIRLFPIMPCDKNVQKIITEKVKQLINSYQIDTRIDEEINEIINKIYGR